MNEQLKPPVAPVVAVHSVPAPDGLQVTVVLDDAANPVPVIVEEDPTGPLVGDRETALVTLNIVAAELVELSVAVTVWLPATAAGTVKLHEKSPAALVVAEHRDAAPGDQVTAVSEPPAKP